MAVDHQPRLASDRRAHGGRTLETSRDAGAPLDALGIGGRDAVERRDLERAIAQAMRRRRTRGKPVRRTVERAAIDVGVKPDRIDRGVSEQGGDRLARAPPRDVP